MGRVEVGYVARAHGVRGELSLRTHDPHSTVYQTVERVFIAGQGYSVVSARPAGKMTIVRLDGVSDRNTAEQLRGNTVEVARDELALADGEELLSDLVGLTVVHTDGTALGEVVAIEMGPQNRLVVHDGAVERLIPVVGALVLKADYEAGQLLVDLPADWPESPATG